MTCANRLQYFQNEKKKYIYIYIYIYKTVAVLRGSQWIGGRHCHSLLNFLTRYLHTLWMNELLQVNICVNRSSTIDFRNQIMVWVFCEFDVMWFIIGWRMWQQVIVRGRSRFLNITWIFLTKDENASGCLGIMWNICFMQDITSCL